MNMKEHILAALREIFEHWQALLAGMNKEQLSAPLLPDEWSPKDVMTHLWAWQQRSIARCEAVLLNREPEYPQWLAGVDPEGEGSPDQINAWIHQNYRNQSWSQVYLNWSQGFTRFLEIAGKISEKDLLDSDKYPWLQGYPLALSLISSYDHHQEHFEQLVAWLQEHRK